MQRKRQKRLEVIIDWITKIAVMTVTILQAIKLFTDMFP